LRLRPGQPAAFILACHTNFVLNRGIPQGVETALLCMNVLALIAVCLSIGFPGREVCQEFRRAECDRQYGFTRVEFPVRRICAAGAPWGNGAEHCAVPACLLVCQSGGHIGNMVSFDFRSALPAVYGMLIQLGFAVVIMAVALVLTKQRRVQRQA